MRKLDGQLKGTGIVDTFKWVVPRGGMQGLAGGDVPCLSGQLCGWLS